MTLQYLLSVLAGDSTDASVARTAVRLATDARAHVDAMHVVPRAEDIAAATAAAGGMPTVIGTTIETEAERLRERASRARETFETAAAELSRVDTPGAGSDATCRYVEMEGRFGEVGLEPVRVSDMCVAALPGEDGPPGTWQVAESLLFDTGRPVLFVPAEPDTEMSAPATAVVGWNASAQAARALHDALPLLGDGAQTTVVAVGEPRDLDPPRRMLARHGLDAETTADDAAEDAGEALMSLATGRGANLIVMGAFGQSRLREFVFGGATQTVLRESKIPVLMAH